MSNPTEPDLKEEVKNLCRIISDMLELNFNPRMARSAENVRDRELELFRRVNDIWHRLEGD